jgi:hypothetical protein
MTQEKSKLKLSKLGVYSIAVTLICIVLFAALLFGQQQKAPSPGSTSNVISKGPPQKIVLYEGEVNATAYGFGTTPNHLTCPGPQLNLTQDISYTLTVYNVGSKPHNFAVVGGQWAPVMTNGQLSPLKPISTQFVQFGASVGTENDPIQPGSSGTVTFTVTPDDVNQYPSLTYVYCSQLPQDANGFNMWGPMEVYSA